MQSLAKVLKYPASAGAGALLLGEENLIAEIEAFETYNSDTPDIYRLDGDRYLTRGGGAMVESDVGLPAHTRNAVNSLLQKLGKKPKILITQYFTKLMEFLHLLQEGL